MLDQVEEGRLTPVDVVEDTNERRFGRCLLERLAKGPGDLVRRRRLLRVTENGGDCGGGRLVRRPRSELEERLGHGPVGDSFAVGEAASTHDLGVEAGEELVHESRFTDAGGPEDREELARAVAGGTSESLA